MTTLFNRALLAAVVLNTLAATAVLCDTAAMPAPAQGRTACAQAFPAQIAGFCAGVVVGTAVCFLRYLHRETLDGAHGLVGSLVKNENNTALLIPAALLSLPAATIVSALEAPAYAFKNAYMADRPFSKKQFSLGKLEDPSND